MGLGMRTSEVGSLKPTKGAVAKTGLILIAFDAIQECKGSDCPIYEDCPYVKKGRCTIELKYLDAVQTSIFKDIGTKMTQNLQNKITLFVMPMFQQLIRMKMEAFSVQRVTYVNRQGTVKIHPIYSEIRSVIQSLCRTMEHLGMSGDYLDAIEASPGDAAHWNIYDGMSGYAAHLARNDAEKSLFPDGRHKGIRRKRLTDEDARRLSNAKDIGGQVYDVNSPIAENEEFEEISDEGTSLNYEEEDDQEG